MPRALGSFWPGCPWHVLSTLPTSGLVPDRGPLLSPTTCHLMLVSYVLRDYGSCPPLLFYALRGLWGAAWLLAPTLALPRRHLKTRPNKSVATGCKGGFELPGSQSKMGNKISIRARFFWISLHSFMLSLINLSYFFSFRTRRS